MTEVPLSAPSRPMDLIRRVGPGLIVAATGVGAGDLVAASVAGSRYGYALLWACVVGAALKYVLNEGIARWQLATGMTMLEGWTTYLGRWAQGYFLLYTVVWSFVVGAALISACGLAAHAIAPVFSVAVWGLLHSFVAVIIVLVGQYKGFERLMEILVGVMFLSLLVCAFGLHPPHTSVGLAITEADLPKGSGAFVMSVIGGVGGSLTLLSYGYWIREARWQGLSWLKVARLDLGIAYILTGLFGIAVMLIAAILLHPKGLSIQGNKGILVVAEHLRGALGAWGFWIFLLGFWAAVMTSMLGVWQSVPYLFCDFLALRKKVSPEQRAALLSTKSRPFRLFLLWIAFPPALLLFFQKPVALIVLYAVIGSLFMPWLALTLLLMNNRTAWVGPQARNGLVTNTFLVLALALFLWLGGREIYDGLLPFFTSPKTP